MTTLSNSPLTSRLYASITAPVSTALNRFDQFCRDHWIFVCFQLAFLSILFFLFLQQAFPTTPLEQPPNPMSQIGAKVADAAVKVADATVPAPAGAAQLDPPKDTPYTKEELAKYDGRDDGPIYVAIKGTIYDVTAKRDMYGPGKGYNVFVAKDASRALGKSSLKAEDAVSDYSTLKEDELKVLSDWEAYFKKRYNIVGKVTE
ncbi:hypothetical protein JCM10207_001118 [Rhodosporidiobolus poonsookiae]